MIKALFTIACIVFLSSAYCQDLDSATYKKTLIQFYRRQTMGINNYEYRPEEHSQLEQDTLFANALVWRKFNIEYPVILKYLKIKQGTPLAAAKVKYLEDHANWKEREDIVAKATEQLVNESKATGKHVAPGLLFPSTSGKIENHDKEIRDKVINTWKF